MEGKENDKWKVAVIYQCRRQDVPGFRNATKGIFADPGLQHLIYSSRGRTATEIFTSSRVRIATKGYLERIRHPAKGSFSRVGIATISMYISPDSELRQEYFSSRVRIAIMMILDQIQEYSKVFVFQIRDCNKSFNPPESGLH